MKQEMQTTTKKKNGVHEQKRRRRWLRLDLERMHLRQQKADGETHEADETLFFSPLLRVPCCTQCFTNGKTHTRKYRQTHAHTHTHLYI